MVIFLQLDTVASITKETRDFFLLPSPRLGEGERSSDEVRLLAQVLKKIPVNFFI